MADIDPTALLLELGREKDRAEAFRLAMRRELLAEINDVLLDKMFFAAARLQDENMKLKARIAELEAHG